MLECGRLSGSGSRLLMLGIALLGEVSCTQPQPVLNLAGPVAKEPSDSLIGAFADAYSNSRSNPNDSAAARKMLGLGLSLAYQNCSLYFSGLSSEERTLGVLRDSVAIAGSLTTAILAATGTAGAAVVGVGTATAYSGMDVYSKHALFDSQFVDDVRDLVLRAQVVHAGSVSAIADNASAFSFGAATTGILDNDALCTNSHIRRLVQQALANGSIVALKSGEDGTSQRIAIAKAVLGGMLNGGVQLSDDELTSLYWLLKKQPSAAELQRIGPVLSQLKKPPVDGSGVPVAAWTERDAVLLYLNSFEPATVSAMDSRVEKLRGATDEPVPGAPLGAAQSSDAMTGIVPHVRITVQ